MRLWARKENVCVYICEISADCLFIYIVSGVKEYGQIGTLNDVPH